MLLELSPKYLLLFSFTISGVKLILLFDADGVVISQKYVRK